jgi:hypothetical protein
VTLAAIDGYARLIPDADSGAAGAKTRLFVVFADKSNLCGTGLLHPNETLLNLDLESPDTTLQPGTFPIYGVSNMVAPYADAPLVKLDTSCTPSPDRGAQSGSVTITSVDSTHVTGSFNITYADGNIQGSFNVPLSCPAPAMNVCTP